MFMIMRMAQDMAGVNRPRRCRAAGLFSATWVVARRFRTEIDVIGITSMTDGASSRRGGLILAAPASGSGKTLLITGLLRNLRDRGWRVAAAKAGPDYIDPTFHEMASGGICLNLDAWAMRGATLRVLGARVWN